MKRSAFLLFPVLFSSLCAQQRQEPLAEFSYATAVDPGDAVPIVTPCRSHLLLTGSAGVGGGFRLAAHVTVSGDTLIAAIAAVRADSTLGSGWTRVRWQLIVWALPQATAWVRVFLEGRARPALDQRLSSATPSPDHEHRCTA